MCIKDRADTKTNTKAFEFLQQTRDGMVYQWKPHFRTRKLSSMETPYHNCINMLKSINSIASYCDVLLLLLLSLWMSPNFYIFDFRFLLGFLRLLLPIFQLSSYPYYLFPVLCKSLRLSLKNGRRGVIDIIVLNSLVIFILQHITQRN